MKTGVLLVSHSDLADGMKNAVEFIAGNQENFYSLGLSTKGIETFRKELQDLFKEISKKVDRLLIICDIPSGSPITNSYTLAQDLSIDTRVLVGMNLSMVLDLILSRDFKSMDELIDDSLKSAKESIQEFYFHVDEDIDSENF